MLMLVRSEAGRKHLLIKFKVRSSANFVMLQIRCFYKITA